MHRFFMHILAATLAIGSLMATASIASAQDCNCAPGCCCSGQPCCCHKFCNAIAAAGGGCDCWTPTCCDCGYMLPVYRSRYYNWNRNYANTEYGQPVALLVPPTAQLQTNYGWGVASSRISRIDHQFQRNYPGSGPFGGPFRPTPVWPSDTTQFGVYPVRGPW
jgi:hypothetical protein